MSSSTNITPSKTRAQHSKAGSTSSMFTAQSSDSIPSDVELDSPTIAADHQNDGSAVGLSHSGNAGSRKTMLQLINRLRDTGVQTDIDLPMIAVIGNQSTGKSSLIESISGITLPRSLGTCTQCPTECKLAYSESPWRCLVKLHFITDASGTSIPTCIVPFGSPIIARSLVEDRIRRAQRAVLNPSKDPHMYLERDELSDDNELSFSKNYVSLEISGPELTDLSFVDLPGLSASVGRGSNDRDIDLVKSLVTSYIEKPSCVILLTVACETDFENQGAHHLAKQYDPIGNRTVGVLTKPDRIPPGDEPSWLKILRNETEPLANNWYCVKQPSSQDVSKGITWKQARQQENDWFGSTQPWSSLEPQYQRFLRTSCLTQRLSVILSDLIAKRLPKIQEELMNAIQETDKKLRSLPKAPSNDPFGEVPHILNGFVRDLECRVEGAPGKDGLLQTIRPHQEAFKLAIRGTAPYFVPWSRTTNKELPKAVFLANEDGDDDLSREDNGEEIYIDEVLKQAQDARTRELPDNYPFVVQRAYIKAFTEKWGRPAMTLFDEVHKILKDDLSNRVEDYFVHVGSGNAKQAALMILHDHLNEAADRTKGKIQWLLDLEGNPTTLNTHYYADYKDKFLGFYKAARGEHDLVTKLQLERWNERAGDYEGTTSVNRALAGLNEIGIPAKAVDLPKLLPPDMWGAALDIMASVRAYFQVAYKRFADMVAMTIDYEIVLAVHEGIHKALQEGLQITGPDAYNRSKSMEEPFHIVSTRQETQERMQRLQTARQELKRLV